MFGKDGKEETPTMNNDALENLLERLHKEYQVIDGALDAVRAVKGLEQQEKSLKSSITALEGRKSEAEAEAENAEKKAADDLEKAREEINRQKQQAQKIKSDGQAEHDEIVESAKQEAKVMTIQT